MKLSFLKPAEGSTKTNKRLGRGHGSGGGGTAGKGHKGAKSRSGNVAKKGFEGGQMPLQRRVPKFGFKNFNRIEYKAINLDALQLLVEKTNAKTIDLAMLQANGLSAKSDLVKILGRGEITSAVEVVVNAFSSSAIEAIEKAGGKAVVYKKTASAVIDSPKVVAPVKVKVAKVAEVVTEVALVAEVTPVVELVAEVAPVVEVVAEVASVVEAVAEVTPVVEAVAELAPVAEKKASKINKGDDLKLIEGIGPKIADLFISAGIDTFAKLADASVEQMKSILETGGPRYTIHDPSTWAEQAVLARDGKLSELKELQDRLNGGKA